jgi:hypothetical protein
MSKLAVAVTAGLAVAASLAHGQQIDTPRVGVTSAVNPSAAGTPPGAATRQLVVGSDVIFRERVITTDDGQAQLLFLDQSALMIGPNSSVVIDEFVYDPNAGKGNIAATLTQGSFRYIGGKLSKQGNATLRTPVATIGIRGSDVTVTFDRATSRADVITTHGSASIETRGGVLGLRTGFGATIGALDQPPGQATALTSAQIAAVNKIFEGQPGKVAGAREVLTNDRVANSQLSSAVEARRLAATEPASGGDPGSRAVELPVIPPPRPEDNGASSVVPQAAPNLVGGGPPGGPSPSARNNRTLNGFVSGFARVVVDYDGARTTVVNDLPTDVAIRTIPDPEGTGRVLATFSFHGTHGDLDRANIALGDGPGGRPAKRSVFLDDRTFSAIQEAAARRHRGEINGVGASAVGAMASMGGLNGDRSAAANHALCECRFVEWGVWEAKLRAPSTGDRVHVTHGLWVAGVLPDIGTPSPQGVATFSGTALGFVRNHGRSYHETGTFTNTYDFGQRAGDVRIDNFDGRSFGGTVRAGDHWRAYSGAVSGSGLTGTVSGAFYGAAPGQQPNETAGNFNVGKRGYAASGIFVGKR